jgi:UDP-perosamine 4-acetyltransferase
MRVVGIGAGGHAKVVIDILRHYSDIEMVGLTDANPEMRGREVLGCPILGGDDAWPELLAGGVRHAFIGVGSVGHIAVRRRIYEDARAAGFDIVTAIHPTAIIASTAMIGPGATIMAGAIINADSRLGQNVIVNTGAIVDHDCVLEDHVHVATAAALGGSVVVREGAHIGAGAVVRQCVVIGRNAIVGAGAAVVEDISEDVTVVGVPARERKRFRA